MAAAPFPGNGSTGKFSFKGKEEAIRNMGLTESQILYWIRNIKIKQTRPVKAKTLVDMRNKRQLTVRLDFTNRTFCMKPINIIFRLFMLCSLTHSCCTLCVYSISKRIDYLKQIHLGPEARKKIIIGELRVSKGGLVTATKNDLAELSLTENELVELTGTRLTLQEEPTQIMGTGKRMEPYSPLERIKDLQKIGYRGEQIKKQLIKEMQIFLLMDEQPESSKNKSLQEFIGVVESAWIGKSDARLSSKLKGFGAPENQIAEFVSLGRYDRLKEFNLSDNEIINLGDLRQQVAAVLKKSK